MKKQIIAVIVLSAVLSLTGCGANINFDTTQQGANIEITAEPVHTEAAATASTAAAVPTAATPAATTAPAAAVSTAAAAPSAACKISGAEIVAYASEEGTGYMFRLNVTGEYAYWRAEVSETSIGTVTNYSVTNSEQEQSDSFFTGGSQISDLRAVVTPYDTANHAGTPISVVWDHNRVEMMEKSQDDVPVPNAYGFYAYTEPQREGVRSISITEVEGEWMRGQYVLTVHDCTRLCGLFDGCNESGAYSGIVRLEYTMLDNGAKQLWYNFYTNDGNLNLSCKADGCVPVNQLFDERENGLELTRLVSESNAE